MHFIIRKIRDIAYRKVARRRSDEWFALPALRVV